MSLARIQDRKVKEEIAKFQDLFPYEISPCPPVGYGAAWTYINSYSFNDDKTSNIVLRVPASSSGYEGIAFKLQNLISEHTYTLEFDAKYTGSYDSRWYWYTAINTNSGNSWTEYSSWSDSVKQLPTSSEATLHIVLKFTYSGTTLYWRNGLSRISDGTTGYVYFSNIKLTDIT